MGNVPEGKGCMTDLGWRLVEGTAQLLEFEEREAVLGDLLEAREGVWRAVLDVVGLASRRQLLLWKSWRPWVAAFGVALPCSFQLMGFSLLVSSMFRHVTEQSLFTENTAGTRLWMLACRISLLAICAWSGGFAVGTISRRTFCVSAAACFLPCLFCLSRFATPSQSSFELLLYLPFAIWGGWMGLRRTRISSATALALAGTATVLAIPAWTGPWILAVELIWPGWFLVATASKQPANA